MTDNMAAQKHVHGALLAVRQAAPQLLARIQGGVSKPPLELIYTSHPRWPLPPSTITMGRGRDLTLSVLDSSFNPPSRAHLALACSPRPCKRVSSSIGDYDAKLLLLSVKNVDKTLKTGDATYLQRLEMMSLLAHRLDLPVTDDRTNADAVESVATPNVAIAITDQPTFVGKSSTLSQFLAQRMSTLGQELGTNHLETTFLLGLDTLERLFSSRYYASESAMVSSLHKFLSPHPDGDNCRIAFTNRTCASQLSDNKSTASLALKKEFETAGRIATIEINQQLSSFSSSAVRESLARGDLSSSGHQDSIWKEMVTPEVADYIREHRLYIS